MLKNSQYLYLAFLAMGCAGEGSALGGAPYTAMSSSAAASLVSTAASMCSSASTGIPSGAAPSSINVGTIGIPASNTYILGGGTTTVIGGVGNIWIQGAGAVIYNGNFSGNLQVCGPEVRAINGSGSANANINVVGGDVFNISNFSGNVAINNGRFVGLTDRFLGNVAWQFGGETQGRSYSGQ